MMSVSRILIVDRLHAELLQFRGYDKNLEWSAHSWLDQVYRRDQHANEATIRMCVLIPCLLLCVKDLPSLPYAVAEGGIIQLVRLEAGSCAYGLDDKFLYRYGA